MVGTREPLAMRAGYAFSYVSPMGNNALVCLTAKAGSSAWFFALHLAHDERRFRNGSRLLTSAHGKRLSPKLALMPLTRAYASRDVPRFAIVRHPITRLLSGWLGKVVAGRGRGESSWPLRFVPQGPRNQTFGAFVRHVVTSPRVVELNGHFKLQSAQCAGKRPGVRPWHILRVEEVGAWYEDVVCTLGLVDVATRGWETFATTHLRATTARPGRARDHGQPCMVRTACGCRVDCARRCNASHSAVEHASFNDAHSQLSRYYTAALAGMVNRWAAPDYAAFNYAPWSFGTDITAAVRPWGS